MKQINLVYITYSILIVGIVVLNVFTFNNQIVDKWIEKSQIIDVLTPITINNKQYLVKRKVMDRKDYVLRVSNEFKTYNVYTDSLTWFRHKRGDYIYYGFTTIDRSKYRLFRQSKIK